MKEGQAATRKKQDRVTPELSKTALAAHWRKQRRWRWLRVPWERAAQIPWVRRLGGWLLRRRLAPTILAASLIVVTTALAALTIERLLPPHGDFRWSGPRPSLWWVLGISALLLILFLAWQQRIRQDRGSSYVLEFQDQGAPHWHTQRTADATIGHADQRILGQRIDPGPRGVIDVRDQVSSMSAQLRAEQNSADNATGFDYFPNLLFPVGLALGYSWDPPARARFWEVNGPAERRAWEYSYPLLDILGLPEERIQLLEVDCDPEEVRCIALSIMLTMGVSNYKQGEPFGRIDGFAGFGRSFVVGVGAPNKGGVLPVRVQPNGPTRSGTQNPVLTPAEAIVSTGRAIRQVFASFPNTPIVLTGRVTKTVSMALGWYLANAEVEIGPGVSIVSPKHPWRWLIPLGDFGPEHTLRPMWVRHDQPDPAELLKEAEIRWAT